MKTLSKKRKCGSCNLCCNYFLIHELNKPAMEWCQRCDIGKGCKIYDQRPAESIEFSCVWLVNPRKLLGEHWFPAKSNMIVSISERTNNLYIQTNDGHKNVWREKPFFNEIQQIAKNLIYNVIVRDGTDGWWIKSNGQIINMKEAANAMQVIPIND